MSLTDRLREAIQAIIDDEGTGENWCLSQFIVVMGLERVDVQGNLEATAWYWCPAHQPDWMTTGLLETGMEMRAAADLDD